MHPLIGLVSGQGLKGVLRFDPSPEFGPHALERAEKVLGAVFESATGAHAMQHVSGAQANALDGGAFRTGWSAAVLAEPEGAPAAAGAGPEVPTYGRGSTWTVSQSCCSLASEPSNSSNSARAESAGSMR
jgi:hypothetical protein